VKSSASSLLFALVVSLLGVHPAACQEMGPLFLLGSSNHPELTQFNGFGILLGAEIAEGWAVQVSYQSFAQETQRPGTVCIIFEPRMGCRDEEVETSTELSGTRVSLQRTFYLGETLRLGVGGGGSFTSVTAKSTGESGRKADLNAPKTGQLGGMALISGRLQFFESIPLALSGTFSNHWVAFKACATNPHTYDPYCGVSSFQELALGLLLVF
jgi:hypothetical protein